MQTDSGDILGGGGGIQSYVGMIIYSSTLDTNEKVVAVYGGTTWTKIEERFLLGASSTYAVNSTGGATGHTHNINRNTLVYVAHAQYGSTATMYEASASTNSTSYIPPYKAVYIWERTA